MKLLPLLGGLLLLASTAMAQFSIQQYNYLRNPETSAISDDGKHLYVAQSKGLSVFTIDQQTKKLDLLQTIKEEKGLGDAIITPDNQFVLAASYGEGGIFIYKRAADGQLNLHQSYIGNIEGVAIGKPTNMVISPSGNYLFFDHDRTLFTFRFKEGQLTYVTENTLKGSYHGRVYFSPDNKHVFINYYNSTEECYLPILTLNEQTGHLEKVACLEEDTYPIPNSYFDFFGERRQYQVRAHLDYISFSPDGQDVYMDATESSDKGGGSSIMHYRWINGQLKLQKAYYQLNKKYKINSTKNIYLDGSGGYLYVLVGGNDSGVFVFKRDQTTGALTFVKAFYKLENLPKIVSPYRISFSPDNKGIYVSNYFGGNLMVIENKAGRPSPLKRPVVQPSPPVVDNSVNYNDNTYNNGNAALDNSTNNTDAKGACEFPKFSSTEIVQIEQELKALSTEQARYDYALKKLQNRCLETVQVLRIARQFEVEYLRLELIKFAHYYTNDLENFYLLDTLFTSSRLKQSFKKYLEG